MPAANTDQSPPSPHAALTPGGSSEAERIARVADVVWHAPELPASVRAKWSLEWRLPIFILGLLAAVILVFGTVAYRGVRDAAVSRATDRAMSLSRELSAGLARPRGNTAALQSFASSPAVVGVLRGSGNPEELARSLQSRRSVSDSTLLGYELWTADGTRLLATSAFTARDSTMLASARAAALQSDSLQRSPLFAVGSQVHAWTVTRSDVGDTAVGVVAELRRINSSPRADEQIRTLTGEDMHAYITSAASGDWVTGGGMHVPAPFALPGGDTASTVVDRAGERQYVVQSRVAGAPWVLVLAQPERSIMAGPRAFLNRLLLVGLILLVASTAGAWFLSRRETRPLAQMRDAAEDMARGNYAQRVSLAGGAEIASLAHMFNTMATRIGDAHAVLAHQNAALQKANDAKSRFLAVMSHELRTPLNAIGGYAELLALGLRGPINPVQVEDLTRIRHNKDQLLTIVSDVLHFSRADAGHVALDMSDVPLQEQFADVRETFEPQFSRKGVDLTVEPTTAVVHADASRLRQVLSNLLLNALQFTEAGGSVVLSARSTNEETLVSVRDTGIGIAPQHQAAIFQPFMQVDNSLTRRVGGTGLGLSIVQQLTTAMGGRVTVVSEPGRGSTFTVSLPARADASMG